MLCLTLIVRKIWFIIASSINNWKFMRGAKDESLGRKTHMKLLIICQHFLIPFFWGITGIKQKSCRSN